MYCVKMFRVLSKNVQYNAKVYVFLYERAFFGEILGL